MEALQKVAGGIGSGLSAVGHGAENAAYYAQLADAAYAGHLPQFLANQSAILQDPSIRNRLLQDPGLARILGVPVTTPTYPNAPAGFSPEYRQEEFGAAATAPRAQLPPLGAQGRLNLATTRLLGQPGVADEAARAALGIGGMTPEQAASLGLTVRGLPLRGGGTASMPVQGPQEYPTYEIAAAAGAEAGRVPIATNRGTYMLGKPPSAGTGGADLDQLRAVLETLGFGAQEPRGAAGEQPLGQEGTPARTEAPTSPGGLPEGFTVDPVNPIVRPVIPRQATPVTRPGVQATPVQAAPTTQTTPTFRPGPPGPSGSLFPLIAQGAQAQVPDVPVRTPRGTLRVDPLSNALAQGAPGRTMPALGGPRPRVSAKVGPGLTLTWPGQPPPRTDFSQIASTRVLPLLRNVKAATKTLKAAGVITDSSVGVAANGSRLAAVARLAGVDDWFSRLVMRGFGLDPSITKNHEVTQAANLIAKNLRSTVPLLARGFGEQRTNQQEERRLSDAVGFSGLSATAFEEIMDNFQQLYSTGVSPRLQQAFPDTYQNTLNTAYGRAPLSAQSETVDPAGAPPIRAVGPPRPASP